MQIAFLVLPDPLKLLLLRELNFLAHLCWPVVDDDKTLDLKRNRVKVFWKLIFKIESEDVGDWSHLECDSVYEPILKLSLKSNSKIST